MDPRDALRFSRRTAWPTEENALTRAVQDRRARGLPILDLTTSNPTTAGFSYPPELLAPLATDDALVYAPEPLGHPTARAAVAGYYAARGIQVDPARILITASTSEAYAHLFHLLADPGDEVLVCAPSYPLFAYLADLAGVSLVPYPLAYFGSWQIDVAALRAKITAGSRAILLVTPNNPTGSYLKQDELEELRELAREHHLALIADEVFWDYPLREDRSRAKSLAAETVGLSFAMSGLSKVAALPQLKLAWTVIAGDEALVARAMPRLELLGDTYLSVATPIQLALPRILGASESVSDQIRERTARNLAHLRGAISPTSRATLLDVEGGWYATLRVPATRTEEEWVLALLDCGVLVHPGHFFDFGGEAYLVVSLLTGEGDFERGVARTFEVIEGDQLARLGFRTRGAPNPLAVMNFGLPLRRPLERPGADRESASRNRGQADEPLEPPHSCVCLGVVVGMRRACAIPARKYRGTAGADGRRCRQRYGWRVRRRWLGLGGVG